MKYPNRLRTIENGCGGFIRVRKESSASTRALYLMNPPSKILDVSTSFENRFNTANQNAGLVIVHCYWFILMANVNLSSIR